MKKYYKISLIDAVTNKRIWFHVYGILKNECIVNEYDTILYHVGIHTLSCEEV